jgi:hypothetical protein
MARLRPWHPRLTFTRGEKDVDAGHNECMYESQKSWQIVRPIKKP